MSSRTSLHPVTASWFQSRVGEPTEVQIRSWEVAASGKSFLAVAPTGSGKTLAAFLVALDRLFAGKEDPQGLRVLYLSPLKALGADVKKNLALPLTELKSAFEEEARTTGTAAPPSLRIGIRTGDTTAAERRRQIIQPPNILVSTPESLNILLLSEGGRSMLSGVKTVIVDEIHAIAPSKRGTLLTAAVERLTLLAGEFQRIGLTATVQPPRRAAEFLGGFDEQGRPRDIALVQPREKGQLQLDIEDLPEMPSGWDEKDPDALWKHLAERVKVIAGEDKTVLAFADSRKMTEKIARLINEGEEEAFAWAHHGSLSKEIRRLVEKRLKEGDLRAVVATGSLELGIDVGHLDEILLLTVPGAVSTALQRAGRAGHRPSEVSRARLFPLVGGALLDAAALKSLVDQGRLEDLRIPENPLDMLAQFILALCVERGRREDELYALVQRAWPYRSLPRPSFDSVVAMLRGRFAETRLPALRPRLYLDEGLLVARPGTRLALTMGGGAIPDLGNYTVRAASTRMNLGSLDEKFVWETPVGGVFPLGNQNWRIQEVDDKDVLVVPTDARPTTEPFWRAGGQDRGELFSGAVLALLDDAEKALSAEESERALVQILEKTWSLKPSLAKSLTDYLASQRRRGGGHLPGSGRLVLEAAVDPAAGDGMRTAFLHTFRGGRVNRPLALAIQGAWSRLSPEPLSPSVTDQGIVFLVADRDLEALERVIRGLANPEDLIRRTLESSAYFGGRFREAAGRAMLLPTSQPGRRRPLWMTRMRSRALMEAIARYPDFPILTEAWRSCLSDDFDMDGLDDLLGDLASGSMELSLVRTPAPSPFCASTVSRRLADFMAVEDQGDSRLVSALDDGEIQRLVKAGSLRPRIPAELTENLDRRRRRIAEDYAPTDLEALKAWIAEREAFDAQDWRETMAAAAVACDLESGELEKSLEKTVLPVSLGRNQTPWVILRDRAQAWQEAFPTQGPGEEAAELLTFWLSGRGPVALDDLARRFGSSDSLNLFQDLLSHRDDLVVDRISQGEGPLEALDRDGLEILLRRRRQAGRLQDPARPAEAFPVFLAQRQGLVEQEGGEEGLRRALNRLEGLPISASLWETAVLPARIKPYRPADLDALVAREEFLWVGLGEKSIAFLSAEGGWRYPAPELPPTWEIDQAFPGPADPRRGFWDIADRLGTDSRETTRRLWEQVWTGRLSADDMGVLRRATIQGFAPPPSKDLGRRPSGGLRGWKAGRPLEGRWFSPAYADAPEDSLESEALMRDQIRLLLDRYGVLCPAILEKEIPPWHWGRLSRTIRSMEWSDEVIGGHWFEGLSRPQFLAPDALSLWRRSGKDSGPFHLDAGDPASPCGILSMAQLPSRRSGTWLSWSETGHLSLVLSPGKKTLSFIAGDKGAQIEGLKTLARTLTSRAVSPLAKVEIRRISGENRPEAVMLEAGFAEDGRGAWIYRAKPIGVA